MFANQFKYKFHKNKILAVTIEEKPLKVCMHIQQVFHDVCLSNN